MEEIKHYCTGCSQGCDLASPGCVNGQVFAEEFGITPSWENEKTVSKTEYGIQMYSVRDEAEKSLEDALRKMSEIGYKYIEFAGFFGNDAATVASWLAKYGLVCSGTHTGLGEITPEKIDETIAYHKAIGCKRLIVPGASWGSEEKLGNNIKLLNEASVKLAKEGITLGYHNHSAEFFTTIYGKIIEDEILANTNISLEIDTFWAYNAGLDVVGYLEKHKDRIDVIHIKDGIAVPPENRNYADCHKGAVGKALGEGNAPVKDIRLWAIKNKVLQVVESEGLDPTGCEEVTRCMNYLRTLD